MHYVKNNVHVNGNYGVETIANIISKDLSTYVDREWGTIQILDDIKQKIETGVFDDVLFEQDLTQIHNYKGGFTVEERENIKQIVINEVKDFLENAKGDVNRLEGLIKDYI